MVPGFVQNGLSSLSRRDDAWRVFWVSEACLRDALATLFWLHGSEVATEVKVPGCGRIDVLVRENNATHIIEVKRRVATAGEAVAAFRQVHAYKAFWETSRNSGHDRVHALVTAADVDRGATARCEGAFPGVTLWNFAALIVAAEAGFEGGVDLVTARRERVNVRRHAIDDLAEAFRSADRTVAGWREFFAFREAAKAGAA